MSHGEARDRDGGILAAILASIGVTVAVMTLKGAVHDLGTAGSLFSILGLHVGMIVFVVARRLARRVRKARLSTLRREDRRNKAHLVSMINLCRSLVRGARASGPDSAAAVSAMQHAAYHIVTAKALYGYLFTEAGRRAAEGIHTLALASVSRQACALADLSAILINLGRLEGEILDIDGDVLVARRRREAGAADPIPE
ncbi:MAG: hypothetical protein OXU86_00800 [Thaumarchaeota archaeon]|nr:hypothetical protein [Nitrososphaerota archaeon]